MIVCFCESQNYGTWRLFTFWRKGFNHCYIVDYDPKAKVWLKAECASKSMVFNAYKEDESDLLVGSLIEYATCVDATGTKTAIYFPRWLYCVSFVKHFLGINKWWIITPYQLYCELRRQGHQHIFEKEQGDSNGFDILKT